MKIIVRAASAPYAVAVSLGADISILKFAEAAELYSKLGLAIGAKAPFGAIYSDGGYSIAA